MRLALALAAVMIATGTAWADDTSEPVQRALEVLVVAHVVESDCPAYRPNIALIGTTLVELGVKKEDFTGKYAEALSKTVHLVKELQVKTGDHFCDFVYDFYQGDGSGPRAIEKR